MRCLKAPEVERGLIGVENPGWLCHIYIFSGEWEA